jgi:atypical dual specificity phosphatase
MLQRGGGGSGEATPSVNPPTLKNGKDSRDRSFLDRLLGHAVAIPVIPWKPLIGITFALYVLNQSHLLPRPLSSLVSRALFWPTLPITVVKRIGHWTTEVDDIIIMGGAPFGFLGLPKTLHQKGVRGVINLCEEYHGPARCYQQLGMTELRLPTTDHFEPSLQSLQAAVSFVRTHANRGERVYVHCRAGHGRSAAAVMAWKMSQAVLPCDMQRLNDDLRQKRNVRSTLWKQPNLKQYHQVLMEEMRDDTGDSVAATDETQQILLEKLRDEAGTTVASSSSLIDDED